MKILFLDEKYFDINDVYNSQNDRVWEASYAEADERGGVKQRRKHRPSSNGVAGCLFQGHNALSSLE